MTHSLPAETDAICNQILFRISELENADVVDLPPLYEAVDPDALEAIFAETESGALRVGNISFPYAGYEVTVHFDGGPVVTIE